MAGTNCPNLWSSSRGAIEKSDGMNSFLGGTYFNEKKDTESAHEKGRSVNWQRALKIAIKHLNQNMCINSHSN